MSPVKSQIGFEHVGIGEVLSNNRLQVPLNQREYSWEEEHVTDLLDDLAKAMAKGTYFLGTIVLTSGDGDTPEVSDGQQRLATTTILLAAIRDYLLGCGDELRARSIEDEFLTKLDTRTTELVPRLRLNVDDRAFFEKAILGRPDSEARLGSTPSKDSHRRIERAGKIAADRVRAIVSSLKPSDHAGRLVDWTEFIKEGAEVVVLRVPDHLNAFIMFETLNDRGLRISQADLLKNHLLSCAGDRIGEAQQKWAQMIGTLESLGREDVAVGYLHHFLITQHGPTKASEVFDKIKTTVSSKVQAISFLDELAEGANDYAALWNSDHPKWSEYGTAVRHSIATINRDLRVDQIRPLMFAAARHLPVAEAQIAFRLFVSWSVRFLVVGGRGGLLDRNYAMRAQEIGNGQIGTAKQLATRMADVIPSDKEFQTAFEAARVSLPHLARYYLRAMERKLKGEKEPEWVPSEDEKVITLEHILPEKPEEGWPGIEPELASVYYKRIGNLALLPFKRNSDLGNKPFADKKPVLLDSGFRLTSEAGAEDAWSTASIEKRQRRLASLAVETWPIAVK